MFITLWYGVLDPVRHDLLFANAGHNPPLLLSAASGQIRLLRTHGRILGILPTAVLEDDLVALAPGDLLILYTDGVTDAINPNEESFDMERLQAVVLAHQAQSAAAIAEAIKAAVREFVGAAPQFDDLTLIVVKRLGE